MTDKLISDLTPIGAAIADNTATEVQRNGQTTTEQALGSDWKTYIKSWIAKGDVGLGSVVNADTTTQANVVFTGLTAAAAAADADTFATNQGAGNLKQTLAAVKTWVQSWSGSLNPGYVSGNWYVPQGHYPVTGAGLGSNTLLALMPFMVTQPVTVSQLAARVATNIAASNMQLGIYGSNASTRKPTGTPLGNTSDISTAATGTVSGALGASVALLPGKVYYLGAMLSSATVVLVGISIATAIHGSMIGSATLANLLVNSNALISGLTVSGQTYGTWPDVTSASFTEVGGSASTPFVVFKVA